MKISTQPRFRFTALTLNKRLLKKWVNPSLFDNFQREQIFRKHRTISTNKRTKRIELTPILEYNLFKNRQQPSPLLYSIGIRPARNSRLTHRKTNYEIARCASVFAWSYLSGRSPEQLVLNIFVQHQRFAVFSPYNIDIWPTCNSRLTQRETNY